MTLCNILLIICVDKRLNEYYICFKESVKYLEGVSLVKEENKKMASQQVRSQQEITKYSIKSIKSGEKITLLLNVQFVEEPIVRVSY